MEKNEEKGSGSPSDVIDVLLRDTGESDGAHQRLPLDFISGNIIEMMIPGEDSVPMIMTLAIKYLSDNPTALACLVVCRSCCVLSQTCQLSESKQNSLR